MGLAGSIRRASVSKAILRTLAEQAGLDLTGARIVAGRPVRFAGELADDALGEQRLRQGYAAAGMAEVDTALEPEAAGYRFARTLTASTVHWVGHSLGGLVILRLLERVPTLPPGRVVLLGTPYGDTQAGRALAGSALGARMLGKSMGEWRGANRPVCFPGREIGVIAGTRSLGLGRVFSPDLPRPNDGAVTVAETRLAAACDSIELPVTHTGMLLSRRVARATGEFLHAGRFDRAD